MTRRPLGNADLERAPIGFGAWAGGGPWTFGWSTQDDDDSAAATTYSLKTDKFTYFEAGV